MSDEFHEIFSYSRKQAIEDGVLIDVTKTAKEAGFKYPVAVTHRLWNDLIVPDQAGRDAGQCEEGRLWDVVWMMHVAIKQGKTAGTVVNFRVIFLMKGIEQKEVQLKSVCGPDDDLSPCITVMLPDED